MTAPRRSLVASSLPAPGNSAAPNPSSPQALSRHCQSRDISHVINVMWTLCHFLQTTLFVFIHLRTLFAKTWGVWGYMPVEHSTAILVYPSPKGEKPRLAWGEANPGLGGELRGLGLEELVITFGGASSMTPPLTRQLRCPRRREGNGTTTQLQTFSESCSRRARRSAAALRK